MRYFRLFAVQLRASFLNALQYRADFWIDGFVELVWAACSILPLTVVLRGGRTIGGWSYAEALVVLGCFTVLKAVLEGAINPSIAAVIEHVRKGTLDFVLLKPADAQFLVSTSRFQPWRMVNLITATVMFAHAFRLLGRAPALVDVALAAFLLVNGIVILYALLLLTVSVAFYAVRVDNLTFLLDSVFDAARWPSSVFRGALRTFFTFVLPLVVLTTFPAQALLGVLSANTAAGALVGAAVFVTLARLVWRRAIGNYTSASS